MYDELVKRVRQVADEVCEDYDVDPYNAEQRFFVIAEAADAIEELLPFKKQVEKGMGLLDKADELLNAVKPRWIPVTERLPEAGERVLCYCRANIYEVMKMRTNGDWVYDTNHVYMHSFVTHWMPLPEPPKEET